MRKQSRRGRKELGGLLKHFKPLSTSPLPDAAIPPVALALSRDLSLSRVGLAVLLCRVVADCVFREAVCLSGGCYGVVMFFLGRKSACVRVRLISYWFNDLSKWMFFVVCLFCY